MHNVTPHLFLSSDLIIIYDRKFNILRCFLVSRNILKRISVKYKYFQIVPVKTIKDEFPFHRFFDNAPKPLFKCRSYEEDMEIAEGCFR